MRILIGAPVRQKPEIFKLYLESLRSLRLPVGVSADRVFILHNSPDLVDLLQEGEGYAVFKSSDEYQVSEETHHWKQSNVEAVSSMKNGLINHALTYGYDAMFFVDSDLILHPETLTQLLQHEVDLIANVFWTAWNPGEGPRPNAWDFDCYTFFSDSLDQWGEPGCYQVGMTGACFLISRRAMEAGCNYSRIPNLTYQIFSGEDRHFCIRAACLGFPCWLETTYPATHLYRQSDLEKYLAEQNTQEESEEKSCQA